MKCEHKWGIYGLDRPGALEDYMVARSRDCVALPANIDFDEAAYYTCGAGTGYLAFRRASFGLGTASPLSASAPSAWRRPTSLCGQGPVLSAWTQSDRAAFAREIGIPFVLDPADHDALAHVGAATGGQRGHCSRGSLGLLGGRLVALGAAALGGRVVLVGFGDADNVVDLQASVIQKQLDVLGAWMFPSPTCKKCFTT